MTDPSLRWDGPHRPEPQRPVLIVMLTGWIDAGGAAAAAMQAIHDESDATPVAVFDDDVYIDYRARRPVMELRDGINTVLGWNHITLSTGRDRAGHDLLLLSGPEPDMAWHRFVDIVADAASDLGVSMMVDLGAYPFTTPHTRPSRISVTSPSPDLAASVPYLRSSVDVPAGVAAALEIAVYDRDIPAIGLWAQVPHYIATAGYPAASVALLDALREVADVVVDASELRHEVIVQRRQLDELVAGNADHQRMLEQLEQLHDASADTWDGGDARLGGPGLELRSGDELAAELERFLRDQD